MNRNNIFKITIFSLVFVLATTIALAKSDKGNEMSQQHQSKVAKVVQELTELAGKDQNIGEEVRVVAQEQKESNERATEAIEAIEERGGFKTFLIGTDYKNIGALRSELVTTQNHINRLARAKERTTSDEVKVELDAQITALREANINAETFIQENQDKFSLFGWLVKLF